MSRNRKLVRAIQNFYQQFHHQSPSTAKKQSLWLLRTFIVTKKRPEWVNAGFVLPTVAMVSLVVVLLTIAILFRSFERSKNANNVRVNQAVLNAAMPAIDRAKAKIDKLFTDPTLPRSTPSDTSLYNAFTNNLAKYTFGDETPLEVRYDINGDTTIQTNEEDLENREAIRTAWRFPVDTDNNGKFDSFTVYGIFFRSPSRGDNGDFNRARTPLDARTPPMDDGSLGGLCAAAKGTSASLIGNSGWYKSGANIKKSFFVYAATVPITSDEYDDDFFEQYKGNQGFSAVEYQQDKVRVPIVNNAVVYEDDLEIAPGRGLKLNGRIFTNSNLLTAQTVSGTSRQVVLYQVSSPDSCFYQAQNSKIIVGGNVGYGNINGNNRVDGTKVHLFKPSARGGTEEIDGNNITVNSLARNIAFNSQAYTQRIDQLVEAQIGNDAEKDPREVIENINSRIAENSGLDEEKVRREELEAYFKKRTRKVPFAEVPFGGEAGTASLQGSGDTLRAQDSWIYPFDPEDNESFTSYANLQVQLQELEATEPNRLKEIFREEERYIGDRIIVGNNLPALWFDKNIEDFVGINTPQDILPKTEWTDAGNDEDSKYRYRNTQIQQLISLDGASKRDGFFEIKATESPQNPLDNVGGLRVVTGAGIYVDNITYQREDHSFLPEPQWDKNFVDPTNTSTTKVQVTDLRLDGNDPILVWPDSMPMSGRNEDGNMRQGDLIMRATAVYHYTQSNGKDQTPIACISSYHDPTNAVTAQNRNGLTDVPNSIGAASRTTSSNSHNGIVYEAPYSGSRQAAFNSFATQLRQQARLVFPNGRFVNEPLRNAVLKGGSDLSMAESSAVDTAICAIKIQNPTLFPISRSNTFIDDGTIYEKSFLDARQVKALETRPNLNGVDPDYNLALEQRQPLEVRVTVLDVDKLRKKTIDGGLRQEYLIPNSGIIYATRDDALEDLSDFDSDLEKRKLLSPTDYKLDPTRRPNGIMLINGKHIHRNLDFKEEEKGLILATNVPAYIKGDFNLHAEGGNEKVPVEEFEKELRNPDTGEIDWGRFYDREDLNDNFACRKGDSRLPKDKCQSGDSWRPATVVADAVTILSENYRFGFRNEGDYDLRNNTGNVFVPNYDFDGNGSTSDSLDETELKIDLNGDGDADDTSVSETNRISVSAVRRKLGFFDNNYLTSAEWFNQTGSNDEKGFPKQDSSYVNNFVTPIQRRLRFGEYVMEMCRKLPVETCGPDDWVVQGTETKASEVAIGTDVDDLDSGTTAKLAKNEEDRRYPRRVAFLRDPDTNKLILDDTEEPTPVPIGIDSNGKVQYYPYRTLELPISDNTFDPKSNAKEEFDAFDGEEESKQPRLADNALWFQTTGNISTSPPTSKKYGYGQPLFFLNNFTEEDKPDDAQGNWKQGGLEQPLLIPILQIHAPKPTSVGRTTTTISEGDRGIAIDRNWLPQATHTTTNLVLAQGDTPPRVSSSNRESNGGLENFVRYLETWTDLTDTSKRFNHSLSGSLIQYKRSAYATAPWQAILNTAKNTSIFGFENTYSTNITDGKSPFYTPPQRQWGFDVGLLSQIPDLFAQQFTLPTAGKPNEFFREVSRDDDWVKALLCARVLKIDDSNDVSVDQTQKAVPDNQRPTGFCGQYTGG